MAVNLLVAGYHLIVRDADPKRERRFVAHMAVVAATATRAPWLRSPS
jgi:3-hydroxyisobutyrate dehydrogenase-like beta-hydroxyacid dehydrogenase